MAATPVPCWSGIFRWRQSGSTSSRPARQKRASRPRTQPRQHFEPGIAVGGLDPDLLLIGAHRLHGVGADAAIGAAGVVARFGQPLLQFLQLGYGGWPFAAGEL